MAVFIFQGGKAVTGAHASSHEAGATDVLDARGLQGCYLLADTYANRPAAGIRDRYFYATDTKQMFWDNGTAWVALADMVYSDTRFKAGNFTRDTSLASGDQAVTGVGFQPKAVIFLAALATTIEASVGFSDGSAHLSIMQRVFALADAWSYGSYAIWLAQADGIIYQGVVASFDSDGFTITWTKTGAKTGTATIQYLAFR